MALKTRVWGAGKIVLLAGALVATYLLSAAASMRMALRAREVPVPDLVNRTANDATAAAAAAGLLVKVDDLRRQDPTIEAGRVIGQDPAPGATLRSQRSIRVWLSAGPRAAAVPALAGETERAAEMRLAQDGFAIAARSEIRSQTYPSDVVVAQDPSERAPSDRVALLVNRPETGASYVMPDLIGVNGDRAAEILRGHGFRVAVVGSTPYPGVAAGVVIRQHPQAGFQIAPGEPISLEVSR
jgi:serine/threonine-protein kinase